MKNIDFLGAWLLFVDFLDRIVAWLFVIFGGKEWDPDYGK